MPGAWSRPEPRGAPRAGGWIIVTLVRVANAGRQCPRPEAIRWVGRLFEPGGRASLREAGSRHGSQSGGWPRAFGGGPRRPQAMNRGSRGPSKHAPPRLVVGSRETSRPRGWRVSRESRLDVDGMGSTSGGRSMACTSSWARPLQGRPSRAVAVRQLRVPGTRSPRSGEVRSGPGLSGVTLRLCAGSRDVVSTDPVSSARRAEVTRASWAVVSEPE